MFSTIATAWEQPLKIAARTRSVMAWTRTKIKVRFQPPFISLVHKRKNYVTITLSSMEVVPGVFDKASINNLQNTSFEE